MANLLRKSIVAAIAALGLAAMTAAEAQRSRGGWSGGGGVAVSGGGHRGHAGGAWRGGAWVGGGRGWHRGPGWRPGWGPGWRPGWGPGWAGWGGWGSWGGWGWGVGWNPWAWSPGFWGWSVGVPVVVTAPASGAWILPPSAQPQAWIERPVESAAPAPQGTQAGQWWYWCASAQAYYPYVQTCAEDWQRVTPTVPAGAAQ